MKSWQPELTYYDLEVTNISTEILWAFLPTKKKVGFEVV